MRPSITIVGAVSRIVNNTQTSDGTGVLFYASTESGKLPSDVLLISRKREIRISRECGDGRNSPSTGATLKFLGVADRVAIVVPYQAISSTSYRRPLDKPHHGWSLRRSWLRLTHSA